MHVLEGQAHIEMFPALAMGYDSTETGGRACVEKFKLRSELLVGGPRLSSILKRSPQLRRSQRNRPPLSTDLTKEKRGEDTVKWRVIRIAGPKTDEDFRQNFGRQ
jgi:hypothetical protein